MDTIHQEKSSFLVCGYFVAVLLALIGLAFTGKVISELFGWEDWRSGVTLLIILFYPAIMALAGYLEKPAR